MLQIPLQPVHPEPLLISWIRTPDQESGYRHRYSMPDAQSLLLPKSSFLIHWRPTGNCFHSSVSSGRLPEGSCWLHSAHNRYRPAAGFPVYGTGLKQPLIPLSMYAGHWSFAVRKEALYWVRPLAATLMLPSGTDAFLRLTESVPYRNPVAFCCLPDVPLSKSRTSYAGLWLSDHRAFPWFLFSEVPYRMVRLPRSYY